MNDEQIKQLNECPLPETLHTRKQAGLTLTYIEGWQAIQKANEIFGPGEWSRMFVDEGIKEVYSEAVETKKGIRNDIGVICKYRIELKDGTVAEDIGYGIGQSYVNIGDAYESAVKEAVTDALKRCLRSFGNAFGNCLYDKDWLADNATNNVPKTKPPKASLSGGSPDGASKKYMQKAKELLWKKMQGIFGPALPDKENIPNFILWLMEHYQLKDNDYELLMDKLGGVVPSEAEYIVKSFDLSLSKKND